MPAASPKATLPNGYPADQKALVDQAAAYYAIPAWVLQGVWGMETDFGKVVHTSSAGAVGDFQFLPSTAATYGYPLTNTPNAQQFTQQATSAAHYLSDLFKQKGSWNSALQAYSGGGYGQPQVQQKATSAPFNQSTGPNLGNIQVPNPLSGVSGAITGAFNGLVSDAKYAGVLVGVLILGVILISRAFTSGAGRPERLVIAP